MPIYEFQCLDCRKKTTALVLSYSKIGEVRCRKCGGDRLEKLPSRFATPKSEEARLESLADPSALGGIDENDPQSVARFMKRMGQEMGEDFGDDMEEALQQEMSGEGGGDEGEGSMSDPDEL
jgi:putative FmdB family regulatory protein